MKGKADSQRVIRWLWYGALVLFGVTMAWNLAWVIFGSSEEWMCKQHFSFSQGAFLVALLLCLVGWGLSRHRDGLEKALAARSRWLLWVMTLLLFAFQAMFAYFSCFRTGWDSSGILYGAECLANGKSAQLAEQWGNYYSQHPYQLVITWIFSIAVRVGRLFGATALYSIIVLQCVIFAYTAVLLFQVSLKLTGSHTFSWGVWLVYAMYIGISPWVMIPYSDAAGLLFPIALFWLYLGRKQDGRDILRWLFMGAITAVGFQIKPQTAIVSIAVWLVVAAELFRENAAGKKRVAKQGAVFAAGLVLATALLGQIIIPACQVPLDKEKKFGMAHMAMMGLNVERNGVYDGEDALFSTSCATRAERNAGNLRVIRERLAQLGPGGLLHHLGKKTQVNYGDGSFAWTCEGNFFMETYPDRDRVLSPFFKNLFYSDGKYFSGFMTWNDLIWYTLLVGSLGLVLLLRGEPDMNYVVMALSIVGLTVFELLFEARARYLYTFAPLFVLMGALGWRAWLTQAKDKENALEPVTRKKGRARRGL